MADARTRVNFALRDPLGTLFQFSLSFSTFAILTAIFTKTSLHIIPEGSVGVYWRGGSLLSRISQPGLRLRVPFLDRYEAIPIVRETTLLANTSCTIKGGIVIPLKTVEVTHELDPEYLYDTIKKYGENFVTKLVGKLIRREISSWCIAMNIHEIFDTFRELGNRVNDSLVGKLRETVPGLTIIDIHLGIPEVPSFIESHFLEVEQHRLKAVAAEEKLKVSKSEWAYELEKTIAEARREAERERVLLRHRLENKKIELEVQKLENMIMLEREKAIAEAQKTSALMEAEGNKELLSPDYLRLRMLQLLSTAPFMPNTSSILSQNTWVTQWLTVADPLKNLTQGGE
ncbi:hypothetical protein BSKO_01861 [Bryopsis sp. KO-2023]|nr:hypothetical protein BSKO_01861 [Bryopsis sp. KO-2023]